MDQSGLGGITDSAGLLHLERLVKLRSFVQRIPVSRTQNMDGESERLSTSSMRGSRQDASKRTFNAARVKR